MFNFLMGWFRWTADHPLVLASLTGFVLFPVALAILSL